MKDYIARLDAQVSALEKRHGLTDDGAQTLRLALWEARLRCGDAHPAYTDTAERNAIRNALRGLRRQHRKTRQEEPLDDDPSSPSPTPDQLAASNDLWEHACSRLTPHQASVLALSVQGFSTADIAAATGYSTQHVSDTLYKARSTVLALVSQM